MTENTSVCRRLLVRKLSQVRNNEFLSSFIKQTCKGMNQKI